MATLLVFVPSKSLEFPKNQVLQCLLLARANVNDSRADGATPIFCAARCDGKLLWDLSKGNYQFGRDFSGQINGGDCKGIPPQNALNSDLGIIVICPAF